MLHDTLKNAEFTNWSVLAAIAASFSTIRATF
jgi:hypothetical protein